MAREPVDEAPPPDAGPSDPRVPTPHPAWTKVVTLVVLGAFLLATLVAAFAV